MKTVKLITCSDAAQAHIIQGALENEGISSLSFTMRICLRCCAATSMILPEWTFGSTKPIMKLPFRFAGTE